MKKLSKIFAVVLALALALSILPLGAAAAGETITYDLTSVSGYSTTALTSAQVKTILDSSASATGLTSVTTATNIYKGNGQGGQWSNQGGFLKTGKSNTDGVLTLKFASTVSKVEITCHAWNTSGSDKVKVNNSAEQAAPKNGTKTSVLTFDLATASDTVTITFNDRVFVFAITVTLGSTASGGTTPTPTPTPVAKEGTIAEVLAGAADELWKTTGAINLIEGKNVYIQDATGAICVRLSADPTDLAIGDNVTVEGTLGEYKKLPQLNVDTADCEKVAKSITVTPKEVTLPLAKADLCKALKLSGLTVTEIDDSYGSGTPNVTVSDGTNEIQIYKAVVPADLAVGDKIDLIATLSCYNDTLQLRNDDAADIVVIVEDNNDDTNNDNNDDSNDDTNNDTNNDDTTVQDPDKVGDNTAIVAMTSVMAIAVVALAVLVIGKKRMF